MIDLFLSGVLLAKTAATTPSATVESLGMQHSTYQQSYNDVPVFGGDIKIHTNLKSGERFATGQLVENVTLDTVPTITADEAVSAAQQIANRPEASTRSTTLYIFNEHILNKLKPDENVLVWRVDLFQDQPIFHEYYFINASTGELVYQITGVYSAINRLIYDCSYGIVTGDCYYDATDFYYTGYIYGRSEGQPARGPNPQNPNFFVTSLNDTDNLYDTLGSVYNYYLATYTLDGANGHGGMGDGSATFPTTTTTTTTTGLTYIDYYYLSESDYTSCPNAFFDGVGAMHYCEGYVSTDITGHEYTHAVNYFTVLDGNGAAAGLTYSGESGALNEANSDIFGEALEYYVTGSNDWLMGEDLPGGASRSMSDPTDYTYTNDSNASVPYPDRYNSENLYCGSSDGGGVHINSSVINKAAYLIAVGGTFNTCTVTGIGRAKEEAIFYRAQSTYYTTATDFNETYTALLAACNDLYTADDCKQVEKALRAVEINQAGFCSGTAAVDPGCTAIDTTPTVTNVTSEVADGYYKAGADIDIDVTFSEAVTGDVTVTLETGETDRQCTFSVAAETSGTCNYTVQAGDTSVDLTVISVSGTITDSSGDVLSSATPITNLAANKAIVIDTTKPSVPTLLRIYTSRHKTKRIKTINPETYTKIVKAKAMTPYLDWNNPGGASKYFVKFTDKKNLSRAKLVNVKNKQTASTLRNVVEQTNTTYYLHMVLQDRAGNRSKVKIILKYRVE